MRETHHRVVRLWRRRSLQVLALALAWATQPLAAQIRDDVYRLDRPDAQGPAGLTGEHLIHRGSFEMGYRFTNLGFDQLREGREERAAEDLLRTYTIVPATRTALTHELDLRYGVASGLTLQVLVPYHDIETSSLFGSERFVTRSSGLGDVLVQGLVSLFGEGAARSHLNLGLSIPTGAIDATGRTPLALGGAILPYGSQLGSGSFELRPGGTVLVQNDQGSVGAQLLGTLHLNENDRGYRVGDRITATVWLAPRINDFMSFSARIIYENFDRVHGADAGLDRTLDPTADPDFQGGERVELPFGLSIYLPDGPFAGHRLSVEFSFAAHQDYDGIQMDRNRTFWVVWRKAL
ncbi:MAG: hypothetical protein R3E10_17725 [Gemmatimonadota bacterium]